MARATRKVKRMKLAIVVQKSSNEKIGPVSTTYAPTTHCVDCPLKNNGCYAETGMVGIHVKRLNAAARDSHASPVRTAKQEARGIDGLKARGQALRIHTSGDCPTREAARIVADAAERFVKRGGGTPWSYTHAWRRVPRKAWRSVSVLASVETLADAARATRRGWAVARVVPQFSSDKAWLEGGIRWIPCPAQTRNNVTCSTCKLCLDDDKFRAIGAGIAFEAHGSSKRKAAEKVACAE
jgi:hypothetical protein